jgi:transposase
MHVIGEETSQRLDVVPAQFRVIVTRRPKYACRACEQAVVQAPAPERLIKGGLPTEAMVAYVLVAKYAWHLPLYRQAQMLLAQGLDIKRAILAFWVGYAAAELKPVYLRLRELILASGKIAVDESWRRCSIPAAAAPRKDTSGRSPGTTGPGAGPIRRLSPIVTLPVVARSTP